MRTSSEPTTAPTAEIRSGSVSRSTRVLDAVDDESPDWLGRLGQQLGQPACQRQPPDRGEVGSRRAGEVEPVGRRLGRDPLVREDAARALVDDLQCAQDSDQRPLVARLVSEPHPVDGKRRHQVADQHTRVDPLAQHAGGHGIPVLPCGRAGDVHVDDVVRAARAQLGDVGVGEHVVRWGDDEVQVGARGVAQRPERLETRHGQGDSRASRAAKPTRTVPVVASRARRARRRRRRCPSRCTPQARASR